MFLFPQSDDITGGLPQGIGFGEREVYIFLQQCLVALTDAKGVEATHLIVAWMTVPCTSQIEAGFMNTAGELFVNFKLLERYLTAMCLVLQVVPLEHIVYKL